jgi:hypothetical protein
MMKYTIYHVPKNKLGCTKHYPIRCYVQGFKDGEFYVEDQVSEGCGSEFAGAVEKFWQWYYGLEEHSSAEFSNMERVNRLSTFSPNHASRTGVFQKASLVSPKHIAKTGRTGFQTGVANRASISSPNHSSRTGRSGFQTGAARRRIPCPECGRVMSLGNLGRHRKSRHGVIA